MFRSANYKLDNSRQIRVEILDVYTELRRKGERTEAKGEGKDIGDTDDQGLSFSCPVERIMRIITGLRNQYRSLCTGLFHEMMCTDICHNFGTRQDLDMQLLFELSSLLLIMDVERSFWNHSLRFVAVVKFLTFNLYSVQRSLKLRSFRRNFPVIYGAIRYIYTTYDDAIGNPRDNKIRFVKLWGPRLRHVNLRSTFVHSNSSIGG